MADEPECWRDVWERAVFHTSSVGDSTKVFLLALCRQMVADGRVEVDLTEVGSLLGRSKTRMSARCKEALEQGLLEQLKRGRKNSPAVYRALVPGRVAPPVDDSVSFPPCGTFSKESVPVSRTLSEENVPDHRTLSEESVPVSRTLSQEDVPPVRNEPENTSPPGGTKDADSSPPGGTNPGPYKGREGEESDLNNPTALFEVTEKNTPTKGISKAENKLINDLANIFYDAVGGMTDYKKIRAVVKAARGRDRSVEEIERGLRHVATEGRFSLTIDSLRIAIERTAPEEQRPHLRAVSGGYQPYTSTQDTSEFEGDF